MLTVKTEQAKGLSPDMMINMIMMNMITDDDDDDDVYD
jgi:hypothetical protein